jgi:outer membrane protein TolC
LRLRADADAAITLVAAARARLAVWLGRDPMNPSLAVTGAPPGASLPPPLPLLLSRVENHPVAMRARLLVHAADANIAMEERLRWPVVSIRLGANLLRANNQPSDLQAGLQFDLPVFSLRGPAIARARARRSSAEVELISAAAHLAADLASAHQTLCGAVARADTFARDVLPAAEEAANLALEAYQAGRLDVNAVVSAEQALADARVQSDHAIADRARAFARLEHAVGSPL